MLLIIGISAIPTTKLSTHRRIKISPEDHPLLLACKIVEKCGPSIMELNTAKNWHDEYENKKYKLFFNIVTSKCPYLRKIKIFVTDEKDLNKIKDLKYLRHVSLHYIHVYHNKNTDQLLGDIFQKLECEAISITDNVCLTGKFVKSINCNKFKSLYLMECESLDVLDMLPAVDTLRNLTTLHVDENHTSFILTVHLLFKEMPQLEELALREFDYTPFGHVSFESFSELVNLKRLYMENTKYVNDTLLEALARGWRSKSARTTLHFGVPKDELDDLQLRIYFRRHFKDIDVFEDLEVLGCVEMTVEWFSAACRDPRGRDLFLNQNSLQTGNSQELKIILFDDITFQHFPPIEEII